MNDKKLKVTLLAIAAVMLGAGAVQAGYKGYNNVVVYPDGSGAYGALGDARSSSNTKEQIGCRAFVNGGSQYTYCYATDKLGAGASCITYDPVFTQRAAGINGDQFIYFLQSGGTCTYLSIDSASSNTPKTP
jgi:hypothetical protein